MVSDELTDPDERFFVYCSSDLGLLYELGDDNRVLLGHCYGVAQVFLQVTVTVGHIHGGSA